MIEPCKICGCSRVFVNSQARGPSIMWFDENGTNTEIDNDRMYFQPSSVVRCEDCGKIRQELTLDGRKIIHKKLKVA